MNDYVADTMAIVLWLEKRKMPQNARVAFKRVEDKEAKLYIPGMALVEVGYLSGKNRIDIGMGDFISYLNAHDNMYFQPIDLNVIFVTYEINDIPELHAKFNS